MFNRHFLLTGVLSSILSVGVVHLALAIPPDEKGTPAGKDSLSGNWKPRVEKASDEGELAIGQFRVPEGFKVDLVAAEPMLANPVAFHIDERGRFYVVETFRFKDGVIDVRDVMTWLDDDTASRTVAARRAMVTKHLGEEGVAKLERASDRIKLIEDTDGDGKADRHSVFADGWNKLEDGVASGVISRNAAVYVANVPALYLLQDTDGDGRHDPAAAKTLHYGYGNRYAYLGHDLHGLVFGPDGKLYFSMGDRGLNIEQSVDGKLVSNPDSGSVLRCNPDGSDLELVHTGLRNPQELAFDRYGNLFTGDNNCDGGDAARWVHVVEGGDSGWRIGYQHQEFPGFRGPWNTERLWDPNTKTPGLYMLPPLANLKASGPSGLTYNPGTGMPAKHDNSFFLADFRGGPGNSGIHELVNKPKGATFEVDQKIFASNLLPTDVDFGPQGGMYYTEWTAGWDLPGKGRIYRIHDPKVTAEPIVAEVKKLLAEDFSKRKPMDLIRLLEHKDMRVRQKAQFALADRGQESVKLLTALAKATTHDQLARIHAVWALGQVGRKSPAVVEAIVPLLSDQDPEIRAQAAKVLGDAKVAGALDGLIKLMSDDSSRVRFFAAQSLGKLGDRRATPAIVRMIEENDDRDPYLRHAGVMALLGINDPDPLRATLSQAKPAARVAVLLALRRQRSPEVAQFLTDPDPRIVLEAARAINDEPIEAAMPALAALIQHPKGLAEPVLARVVNANYRLGNKDAAEALVGLAKNDDVPALYRVDALKLLGQWEQVPGRNHITGVWNPLPPRDGAVATEAAAPALADLLTKGPDEVRIAAAGLAETLKIDQSDVLYRLASSTEVSPKVRAAALHSLAGRNDERLAGAVQAALKDPDASVRREAIALQARLPEGTSRLAPLLETGTIQEQQAVLAALAASEGAEPDPVLSGALDRLSAGAIPPEVQLDVLEAAAKRRTTSAEIAQKLDAIEAKRPKDDPLAEYRETLAGGDAQLGEKIFEERADVSCIKCHSVNGFGGNAGPDLAGVGAKHPREYLLESLLLPPAKIAEGWEAVIVRLKNGEVISGIVKGETDQDLVLNVITDPTRGIIKPVTVKKKDIDRRRGGQSAMPEGLVKALSKRDVRNLIEYLASLKEPSKQPQAQGN
jgi:quinoprotein glucose dehydrogenase